MPRTHTRINQRTTNKKNVAIRVWNGKNTNEKGEKIAKSETECMMNTLKNVIESHNISLEMFEVTHTQSLCMRSCVRCLYVCVYIYLVWRFVREKKIFLDCSHPTHRLHTHYAPAKMNKCFIEEQ